MRQYPCSHKGMDVGISYLVITFLCMQKVLSGTISDVQCLSSSGTVGKSSSSSGLSEYTGVLSGSWSSSELSEYTGVLSGS